MRVHRFMSELEYRRLISGETLHNESCHEGWLTSSVGFCFFTEDPDEAIHWLSGVTFPDYCVTMEVRPEYLRQSVGHYRNPEGGTMEKAEYCMTSYSLKTVMVVAVTDRYRDRAELRRVLIALGVTV